LRTDLVISNPPDFKGILPVRSNLARAAGSEPAVPEKSEATPLRELERPVVGADPQVYQSSPSFDANGEFLPPLSFGAAAYRAVEKNAPYGPKKGVNLSVYA